MDFATLSTSLAPLGWIEDGDRMVTPCGGFWVERWHLDDPRAFYGVAARRADRVRRGEMDRTAMYDQICRVLGRHPAIEPTVTVLERLRAAIEPWAAAQHAVVSLWDFSHPAIRVTARSPTCGVACAECAVEWSGEVDVWAGLWTSEHGHATTTSWSWKRRVEPFEISVMRAVEEAWSEVLAPAGLPIRSAGAACT